MSATKHTYPSEVDTARRCWRKWAFKYLGPKEKFVQSANQILGDQMHDLSERWNKLGQPPEPGRSVADDLMVAALPWEPLPRTGESEGDSRFELSDVNGQGLRYGSRTDWAGLSDQLPKFAEFEVFGVVPVVRDLKTSSDPLRYGMWTREKWLDDTAAVIYLLSLAVRKNADCVGGRWLYLKTPKKLPDGTFKPGAKIEAMPSDVVLGRDALGRAHLNVIAPFKRGIDDLRAQAQSTPQAPAGTPGSAVQPLAKGFPFNMDACNDFFKPCEYLDRCAGHFDVQQMVSAGYPGRSVGENHMGMMSMQGAPGQLPPPVVGQGNPGAAPVQGFQAPPVQYAQQPATPFAPAPVAAQYQAPQAPVYQAPPAPTQGFTHVNPPEAQAAYNGAPQAPVYQAPVAPPAPVYQAPVAPPAPALVPTPALVPAPVFQAPVAPHVQQAALSDVVSLAQALDALKTLVTFLRQ